MYVPNQDCHVLPVAGTSVSGCLESHHSQLQGFRAVWSPDSGGIQGSGCRILELASTGAPAHRRTDHQFHLGACVATILRSGGTARPLLCLAALLLAGCTSYRVEPPTRIASDALVVAPFVETLGPTNATIVWETRDDVYGWLTLAAPDTNRQVRTAARGHIQRVTLAGLVPGVTYQYRVSGSDQPWQRFITLDPRRSNFVFVVFGDNRSGPKPFRKIARRIAKLPADFAIVTGDIAAQGSRREDWFTDWFVPGAPVLAAMPVLVAWGNHEEPQLTGSWLQVYYRARSQFHGQAYFSYRNGPVHFIHLNCYEALELDSPQYRWCAQELAGSDAPFIVVAYHVSPLSGGNHARDGNVIDLRKTLVPLLARYNVSLSLTGHDHLYNRSAYAGTTYVIAGSSGAPLHSSRLFLDPFSLLATSLYHYVVCNVSATQLTARVYSEDGALVDAFSMAPRPRLGAPPPAIASFDPPLHDYIEHETFNGQVNIRNFSAAPVAGTISIDAPAAWMVEPGRTQTFFVRGDEPVRTLPWRVWSRNAAPGAYPVTVRVCLPDATNEMRCTLNMLGLEQCAAYWDFSDAAHALSWSNAPRSVVQNGVWRGVSKKKHLPILWASTEPIATAGELDVAYCRMRLSGPNISTTVRLRCTLNEAGRESVVEQSVQVPVNDQWYTHIFPFGRVGDWRGTLTRVELIPVSDPKIKITLDAVGIVQPARQAPNGR